MNGYPHSKHSNQKTGAKYCHGPEALSAAKELYDNKYGHPNANNTNDVSIEHVYYSLFYEGTFFSSGEWRGNPMAQLYYCRYKT